MSTVAASFTIRPLSPATDRAQVAELWTRNLPQASLERFDWLYDDGPARGWLAFDEAGRCFGAAGLMARTFRMSGQDVAVGQAIDLNVDREQRTLGPALKLQRAALATAGAGGYPLIYSLPNKASEPLLSRLGYRPLGMFGRWVKPLRSDVRLRRWLPMPSVAKAVGCVVDRAMRLTTSERRHRVGDQFDVVERFDERFDELWRRARDAHSFIGDRSAAYLEWRFRKAPAAKCDVLTLSRNASLCGYAVVAHVGAVAVLSDVLVERPDDFEPLAAECLRRLRRRRTESVVFGFLGPVFVEHALRRLGFWRRPSTWPVLLYRGADSGGQWPELFEPARWWLTRADIDTDE